MLTVFGSLAVLIAFAMGVNWHYTTIFASKDPDLVHVKEKVTIEITAVEEKVGEVEEKVDLVSVSLRQQILQQRLDRINDQIRDIVIKHGENTSRMPPEIKKLYLQLLDDKAKLLREWDTIVIKK